jgi:hypothetical protein
MVADVAEYRLNGGEADDGGTAREGYDAEGSDC